MQVRKGMHHIALKALDFDATVKFYTEGLGCKKGITWGEGDKRAIMLDAGNGNFFEVFAGGSEVKEPGHYFHLALVSENCDADIERARKAGAQITKEPNDVDIKSDPVIKVRLGFCKGLNGEIIEFFQYR